MQRVGEDNATIWEHSSGGDSPPALAKLGIGRLETAVSRSTIHSLPAVSSMRHCGIKKILQQYYALKARAVMPQKLLYAGRIQHFESRA
jgi:hypothetical protein